MERMTALVIEQIESGKAPFLQPQEAGVSYLPLNPTTQNPYTGINALYLMSVPEQSGFSDHRWLTQKQAASLGAQVLSGTEGVPVLYWKTTERRPRTDAQGQLIRDEQGLLLHETIQLDTPQLASAWVFNGEQLLGLPPIERNTLPVQERQVNVERLLAQSGIPFPDDAHHRAGDQSATDSMTLLSKAQFADTDRFYQVALKALIQHSHHGNRSQQPVGSIAHAKEALSLNLAGLFLGGKLSVGYTPETLQSERSMWVNILKSDPQALLQIAKAAERIAQTVIRQEQVQTLVQAPVPKDTLSLPLRSTERFYIEVDFNEKAQAKALGAKWDRQAKSWYVPPGKNIDAFVQWPTRQSELQMSLMDLDPIQQFERALKAEGLLLQGAIQSTGKLVRVSVEGDKPNEKSGAYVYYGDGHPAGFIQNYKTGISYNWKADSVAQSLSTADRARLEAEAAEKQKHREQERTHIAEQIANQILDFLSTCPLAESHPYLVQKGVAAYGLRLNTQGPLVLSEEQSWSHAGDLLVPVFNVEKELISTQAIGAGGRKSFPAGARMEGGHFVIGNLTQAPCVLLAEGYSTGATLHELSGGLPVVVTFSAGNMPAVARAIHEKYPDKLLLMAGDNEHTKPIAKNVGLNQSSEAARLVGGSIILPEFPRNAEGTDWNDLVQLKGMDRVRQELKQAIQAAVFKAEKNQVLNLAEVNDQNHHLGRKIECSPDNEETSPQRKNRARIW